MRTSITGICDKCLNVPVHRRRVFSLSLGDWLDEEVPIEWLADMLDVIRRCPNLDFLLLTKRPEQFEKRLAAVIVWCQSDADTNLPHNILGLWCCEWALEGLHPENIWLGVSVENQATADERIPQLLQIPAAVRFVSYEPALGPVDFTSIGKWKGESLSSLEEIIGHVERPALDWIIIGGESGPKARPFNVEWARSTIAQCQAAGVACFVKQLGSNAFGRITSASNEDVPLNKNKWLRDSHGGDMTEWSEDLRVRQFPQRTRISA